MDIKFRAFHKERKKVYGVDYIDFKNGCRSVGLTSLDYSEGQFRCDENRDLIMLRYSNWLDQGKNEIYEGHILELVNMDGKTIRVVCEYGINHRTLNTGWEVETMGFYFKTVEGFKSFPIVENFADKHDLNVMKIIGTIHENPELFKDMNDDKGN